MERESRAGGGERPAPRPVFQQTPPASLASRTPGALPCCTSIVPRPHLCDPGRRFFSSIPLERITKVFSLGLLSCDQSIAQEMGSLESCLSKISYFTSWNVLKEYSAPSLSRANISVTCVLGARPRPHMLCLVKENITLLSRLFPLCSRPLPRPPAQLGGHEEILSRLSSEV